MDLKTHRISNPMVLLKRTMGERCARTMGDIRVQGKLCSAVSVIPWYLYQAPWKARLYSHVK